MQKADETTIEHQATGTQAPLDNSIFPTHPRPTYPNITKRTPFNNLTMSKTLRGAVTLLMTSGSDRGHESGSPTQPYIEYPAGPSHAP